MLYLDKIDLRTLRCTSKGVGRHLFRTERRVRKKTTETKTSALTDCTQADELGFAGLPGLLHCRNTLFDGDVLVDPVKKPCIGSRTEVLDRLVNAVLSKCARA